MATEEFMKRSLELVERSSMCLVGSVSEQGFPNVKAMFIMGREGLKVFRFVTGTPTQRVSQFRDNPKACLFFVDADGHSSLMLEGLMGIVEDQAEKDALWQDGFEGTFPKGKTDPDYCVLRFTAEKAKHYPLFQEFAI